MFKARGGCVGVKHGDGKGARDVSTLIPFGYMYMY